MQLNIDPVRTTALSSLNSFETELVDLPFSDISSLYLFAEYKGENITQQTAEEAKSIIPGKPINGKVNLDFIFNNNVKR